MHSVFCPTNHERKDAKENHMKIKVTSDSTCDLPASLLEKYDIDLMPLIVMKDDEEFLDNVTITPDDIFRHVAQGGSLCTTAARSVAVYQELFSKYAEEYDGIIHINLGSGFSSSYQNAFLAAQKFPNVRVVDSQNLCCGQGLLALKAAQLAEAGVELDEIVRILTDYVPKIETSFVLDRLDYMVKGGRCSTVTALGANLLNLKPCIELRDGKMSVGKKYRGHYDKCLANYVKERLAQREDIDRSVLVLVYTQVDAPCMAAVQEALSQCGKFDVVYEAVAGCTISCHCGPNTLGVIFARK